MNARDALKISLTSTQQLVGMFIGDLSDADLLVRPVPGANHIAWQLGHLIVAESGMSKEHLPAAVYPALPAGFAEQHNKDTAHQDPPKGFATKAVYLDLFNKVRQTTIAAVDKATDADLDKPLTGRVAQLAPTLGALFLLNANHVMMHAGQFTVVRRKLGKPVLF